MVMSWAPEKIVIVTIVLAKPVTGISKNIFLIMTYGNYVPEAMKTIEAIKEIAESKKKIIKDNNFPKFPKAVKTQIQSYEIMYKKQKSVSLENAIGEVVAEDVVPYPPGIPLLIKGEVFLKEHLDYLTAIRSMNGKVTVLMQDKKLIKIKVIK